MAFNPGLLGKKSSSSTKKDEGPSDPLTYSKDQLYQKLDAIASSDAPIEAKKAALDQGTKEGDDESPLMKVLSIVDKPRAAIATTLQQVGGALSNAGHSDNPLLAGASRALAGGPGAFLMAQDMLGNDTSGGGGDYKVGLDQAKEDFDKNLSVGEMLRENTLTEGLSNVKLPNVPGVTAGLPGLMKGASAAGEGKNPFTQSGEVSAGSAADMIDALTPVSGGKDLNTALGFAGDVAIDPLNVLGGGSTLEKLGSKGVADLAFQAGEKGIGQKAIKGLANVSQGELDTVVRKLGEQGLLDASNPIHREILDNGLKGGLHLKGGALLGGDVKLLGKDLSSSLGPKQIRTAEEALRSSRAGQALRPLSGKWADKLTADGRTITDLERRGTPQEAHDAFYTRRGDALGESKRAAFLDEVGKQREEILKQMDKGGIDGPLVTRVLEGSPEAIAEADALVPGFSDVVRQYDDDIRNVANRLGGDPAWIAKRDWHAPALTTDEFKQLFGSQGKAGDAFMPAGFEGKASLVHGGQFMGEDILPASKEQAQDLLTRAQEMRANAAQTTDAAAAKELQIEADRLERLGGQISDLTPREQAQEIANRVVGDNAVQIFNPDWVEASGAQLRGMGNRVKGKVTENYLLDKGVARDLFASAGLDPKAVQKYGKYQAQKFAAQQAAGDARLAEGQAQIDANIVNDAQRQAAPGLLKDQLLAQQAPGIREAALGVDAQAAGFADEAARLQAQMDTHAGLTDAAQQKVLDSLGEAAATGAEGRFRLGQLEDLKATQGDKLARAAASTDERLARAADRIALQTEVDDITARLGELESQGNEVVSNGLTALEIHRKLDDAFLPRLQAMAEDIAALQGSSYAAGRGGADAAVKLADKKTEFEQLAKQYKSLKGQVANHGPAIQEARVELASTEQQLRAAGKDTEADFVAQAQANLPTPESGKLASPTGGDTWFHGTGKKRGGRGTLNIGVPPSERTFKGLFDTLLGPDFIDEPWQAGSYSRKAGATPGKERVATAELHATNPKVYTLPEGADPEAVAHAQMYKDGFEHALDRGHLDADTLAAVTDSDPAAWDQVIERVDSGEPLDQVLDETFAYSEYDPLAKRGPGTADDGSDMHNGWYVAEDGTVRDWSTDQIQEGIDPASLPPKKGVADAMVGDVMDELRKYDPKLLQTIADDFKGSLLDQGYDSILYQHGDRWAAKPLLPEQVRVVDTKGATPKTSRVVDTPSIQYSVEGTPFLKDGKPVVENTPKRVYGDKTVAMDMFDHTKAMAEEMKVAAKRRTIMNDPAFKAIDTEIEKTAATVQEAAAAERRNQQVLRDLQAQAADTQGKLWGKRLDALQGEITQRQLASDMRQTANELEAQGRVSEATSLRMQAQAQQAALEVDKLGRKAISAEKALSRLKDPGFPQEQWNNVLANGFKQLGATSQAPDYIVDMLKSYTKMTDPASRNLFLKAYDAATRVFKTYAIMTPGFHMRNFFGGVFNNWLADVDGAAYSQFAQLDTTYTRLMKKGLSADQAASEIRAAFPADRAEAYLRTQETGLLGLPGQVGSVAEDVFDLPSLNAGAHAGGRQGSIVTNNPASRLNYKASETVERHLRGTLAYDRALKGFDEASMLEDVAKYHFDYGDLSKFEKGTMKRVAPFYTWTRKNVPLQLESFLKQPKKYVKYYQLKSEIEQGSPEEALVPNWFGDQSAIRLPFQGIDGKQAYIMPDLPMGSLQEATNWRQMAGNLNPVLKVPVEQATGTQLWNGVPFREGYVEIPAAYQAAGVAAALKASGRAVEGKDGKLYARDADLNAVESMMPLLGRARRAFPSEKKYDQRLATSMVNMIFGAGVRTNTDQDQLGELYRRQKEADVIAKDLNTTGYGGYSQRTGDIVSETKRVPGQKKESSTKKSTAKPKNPYEVLLIKRAVGA